MDVLERPRTRGSTEIAATWQVLEGASSKLSSCKNAVLDVRAPEMCIARRLAAREIGLRQKPRLSNWAKKAKGGFKYDAGGGGGKAEHGAVTNLWGDIRLAADSDGAIKLCLLKLRLSEFVETDGQAWLRTHVIRHIWGRFGHPRPHKRLKLIFLGRHGVSFVNSFGR